MIRDYRPRSVVAILSAVGGLVFAVAVVWLAIDGLASSDEETWIWIGGLACAPVLAGLGLMLPHLLAAQSREETTLVVTDRLSAASIAVMTFVGSLAVAAALGGGWWYLAGVAIGCLGAWATIDTTSSLRHATLRLMGREPPLDPAGSVPKRKVAVIAIRSIASLSFSLTSITVLTYLTLGTTAAIVVLSLATIVVATSWGLGIYRHRTARAKRA